MRFLAATMLLVAPLTFTACGGSSHKQASVPPATAVKQAAHKTAAQTSEHMQLTGTVTAAGQQVSVTGSGDFKGRDGTLQVNFNAGGLAGKVEAVLQGTTLYMRSPLLATTLRPGKTWLKVDLAKAAGTVAGMPLSSLAGQSPAQTLQQLGGLQNVTEAGSEQVDGTDSTHYRGKRAGSSYEVWVGNGDGLIHRLKFASKLAANEMLDATIDLSDFGKPVTITVPPASQTQTGG